MIFSDLKKKVADKIPGIFLWLCLLQPCLDVLSFWQTQLGIGNAMTTALRLAMLAGVVLLGFWMSERKKCYFGLAAVLLLLTVGHVVACVQWGYDYPVADLANMLRIYQLPLLTLSFITLLRKRPDSFELLKKGFFLCLVLCAAIELLSVLTGTNPYTYPDKKVGFLGWFYFANSQSAILSMLVPVALICAVKRKWLFPAAALVGFAVLYGLGTRLAYVSLLAAYLVLAVFLFVLKKDPLGRRAAVILAVLAVVAAAGYSVSPMTNNAELVARNKVLKQQDIEAKVAEDESSAAASGLKGAALETARLKQAYETYLTGPTGRFGLERTAKWYHYSTDAGDIADVRREKLTFNRMLLQDNPGLSRWFGLEREDLTWEEESYDAENDFHGILFLCGVVGLGLMVVFLGLFFLRIGLAVLRNPKDTITLDSVGCGVALCCGLAHAYFTAGVLRRPNATFYLAALLAMAYMLTRKNHDKNEVSS